MTNEIFIQTLAFVTGTLLGGLFFGGLWLTVRTMINTKLPQIWFIVSLLLRTGITMAGFYFVCAGHLDRLVLCLSGFIIARFIVNRIIGTPTKSTNTAQEASHASQPG